MAEQINNLYGNKGIDTTYERSIIKYRPNLDYTRGEVTQLLPIEIAQSIERSRTFTISQNLLEYDELLADVKGILVDLLVRISGDIVKQIEEHIKNKEYQSLISIQRDNSGYEQTSNYELYILLALMRDSLSVRREFLDNMFRTQFTSESDIEKIQEAEFLSIDQWEQQEAQIKAAYHSFYNHDEEDHAHDSEGLEYNTTYLEFEEIQALERSKRNREILHTTLADTSYIHRNRYFMFLDVIEKAKILVYEPQVLIDKNIRELIAGLGSMVSYSSPKSHLILQFKKIREQQESLMGRVMTIDDEKETFGSEKQYLYQQLEVKTVEPIKNWLYEQEEGVSGAIDAFASYMTDSITETRTSYESSIADLLNFYQSESDFYTQQIHFLKNKEEIRKFYSILEDLEEVEQIDSDWIEEYLKASGYSF